MLVRRGIQCRPARWTLSRFFPVAHIAVIAVTAAHTDYLLGNRCEKYLHDTIGAKPARGRVHPVAVLTASSRISRNSRAGWPTVLHQRAPPCEGCPMFIHPDDRPRRTAARCQSRLAIRRASFAISDCWQSPKLRGGLDHTPFSRRCSNISQNGPCTEHTRLCCSSRLSRERGATVACQKSGIYPRFDSAAGLG